MTADYMEILENRYMRGKLPKKKFIRLVSVLMLWNMKVVYDDDVEWEED